MYKLVVLTDADTADGFRLAGVRRRGASTPQRRRERGLCRCSTTTPPASSRSTNGCMTGIDERIQKKIDSIYRPIVVSLPIREKLETWRGPPRLPLEAHQASDRLRYHSEAGMT